MHENPGSDVGDRRSGDRTDAPPQHELRFEGFGNRNGGFHGADDGGPPSDRFDPRVSAIASGARYKSLSPARLPISRSPCLAIPPGLSPTSLLESPVLLTNFKAEPSPTTGTFSMPSIVNCTVGSDTLSSPKESSNNTYDEGSSGDFEFKPHIRSCLGSGSPRGNLPNNVGILSHELTLSVSSPNTVVETTTSIDGVPAEVSSEAVQQEKCTDNGCQAAQIDHKGPDPLTIAEKTSEDGYNWRKYGQKHVKGSEYPRSYYKCTHPNCQMKKQLERSHDGQVTEVIYKGSHDHPKPQPSRRSAVGTGFSSQEDERADGLSSFINTEDKSSHTAGQTSHHIDPNGNLEVSPASASDDDIEGTGVLNNNGDDIIDDDDPETKRRRKDTAIVDVNSMSKISREPRVVVQTLSEVDILDDGYRWRKYGQKVVKGNPNPRSYYKCTNVGCPVRKHVERASHDPKAVITTYEGKHNHDVPAARTSSHDTASSVAINEGSAGGTHNSQMPAAFNGMPRIYGTSRAIPHQYNRSEESDTISLDLGVGLSPRHKQGADDVQQIPRVEQMQNPQNHMASSRYRQLVIQTTPVAAYYGSPSNGMDYFGPREDKGEGFSFKAAPLNHASNSYPANMGSLVTGP